MFDKFDNYNAVFSALNNRSWLVLLFPLDWLSAFQSGNFVRVEILSLSCKSFAVPFVGESFGSNSDGNRV